MSAQKSTISNIPLQNVRTVSSAEVATELREGMKISAPGTPLDGGTVGKVVTGTPASTGTLDKVIGTGTLKGDKLDIKLDNSLAKAAQKLEDSSKPKAKDSHGGPGIVKRSNFYFANPKFIVRRKGWNPRFDFGEIDELAKSIKENGVLNPLRVKRLGDKFELVDGDRRMTAMEQLLKDGHKFPEGVPVIIVDKNLEDTTALVQMFEANTGKPFLPLEEAEVYRRLQDAGLSVREIYKRTGKAERHIKQMLDLLDADPELKEAVKSGKVSKQMAKDIATKTKGDTLKQRELTHRAVAAKKNRKERKAINEELTGKKSKQTKPEGKPRARLARVLSLDTLKELTAGTRKSIVSNNKDMGLKDDTELALSTRAQKVIYLHGLADALKVAQADTEQEAHDLLNKLFNKHGIVH